MSEQPESDEISATADKPVETDDGSRSVPEDPGLPLVPLDRALKAVRRLVSYGASAPGSVRYVEANLSRWVGPLLELPLPDPVREPLVSVAGQLIGIDALETDERRARLRRMRQEVTRLDALLGLPLPWSEHRPRRRPRNNPPKKARTTEPKPARAQRNETSKSTERSEKRERRPPSQPRHPRAFWSGNPHQPLAELDIEEPVVAALASAGVTTVRDLLLRRPARVETFETIHGAGRELPSGRVAVGGRFVLGMTVCSADGRRELRARIRGAGPLDLVWKDATDAERWLQTLETGERVVVVGTWNGAVLEDPEVVFDAGKHVQLSRFEIDDVEDARLQALLLRLMPYIKSVRDPVPNVYRDGHLSFPDAVEALHGRGDAEAGRRRLAFDEAFLVGLADGWERYGSGKVRGIQHAMLHTRMDRLLGAADTRLNDDQQLAFDMIKRDLRRSRPMRRLLVGRPGGGKGLVSLVTSVLVAESKCQVLYVCSTAAEVEQRFTYSEGLLRDAGVVARAVTRKPGGALRDALKRGEIHVLFATPEFLDADVEFRRLGLVISSESQDFGAVSRRVIGIRAPRPDLLVVPTGVPDLGVFLESWPDHDVTILEGRSTPEVVVKHSSHRVSAYASARHAIMNGGQVAVLFPRINGEDALDPAEGHRLMTALGSEALSDARIALLHGAMPRDERQRVLEDFIFRRADALVATTCLEDASPVPGLQVAIVEHAHRMQAARLRRVAGLGVQRVVLVVDPETTEEHTERLRQQVVGEFVPEVVSELPHFRFLDPERDLRLLLRARGQALALLGSDSGLRSGQSSELVRTARQSWAGLFGDRPCPLPEPSEGGGKRRRRRRRRK